MDSSFSSQSNSLEGSEDGVAAPAPISFGAALESRSVRIVNENQAFKPAVAGEEERSYVLEKAIIYHDDLQNLQTANLLEIEYNDPAVLVVYGRLALEADDNKYGMYNDLN